METIYSSFHKIKQHETIMRKERTNLKPGTKTRYVTRRKLGGLMGKMQKKMDLREGTKKKKGKKKKKKKKKVANLEIN